jgi:site-specific DNA-methyltransferase (adenine-specific)
VIDALAGQPMWHLRPKTFASFSIHESGAISPYYTDEYVTIYNSDCRQLLKAMPDDAVDLVLTDPPYGIGENSRRQRSRGKLAHPTDYGEYNWDKKIDRETIDDILRVGKNAIIFGGNYYANWLPPRSCWLVWDKDNTGDFADCELAWTSFRTAVRKFRWRWNGMLQEDMKHKEKRVHPTQKPAALMSWILTKYTSPGELILDPFLGSGTTAMCAKELGRRCIGIEIEERYCELAARRCQ